MAEKSINELNLNSITISNSNYSNSKGYTAQSNTLETNNAGALLVNGSPIGGGNVYGIRVSFVPEINFASNENKVIQFNFDTIPYNRNNVFMVSSFPSTESLSFIPLSIYNFFNGNNGSGGTTFRCNFE